jgi:hypothetical protein
VFNHVSMKKICIITFKFNASYDDFFCITFVYIINHGRTVQRKTTIISFTCIVEINYIHKVIRNLNSQNKLWRCRSGTLFTKHPLISGSVKLTEKLTGVSVTRIIQSLYYSPRYMWPSTLYTKYILVLSVMNLFIVPTVYLNFILILSFNQKAISMGSLVQWFYLERMKVYYPIKILDATCSTHLHTNRLVINANICTFAENITFICTSLRNR